MTTSGGRRRWAVAYHKNRLTNSGAINAPGFTVTDEHPIALMARWNAAEREKAARIKQPDGRAGYFPWTHVIAWYALLGEAEAAELTAAGLDLTAQDAEGCAA